MRTERNRASNVGRRLHDLVDAAGCVPLARTEATQTWTAWDPDESPAPLGCFSMESLADDLIDRGRLATADRGRFVSTVHDAARRSQFVMTLTMFGVVAVAGRSGLQRLRRLPMPRVQRTVAARSAGVWPARARADAAPGIPHTRCAVVVAPTLERTFARWCFTVEWSRLTRRSAGAASDPAARTAATTGLPRGRDLPGYARWTDWACSGDRHGSQGDRRAEGGAGPARRAAIADRGDRPRAIGLTGTSAARTTSRRTTPTCSSIWPTGRRPRPGRPSLAGLAARAPCAFRRRAARGSGAHNGHPPAVLTTARRRVACLWPTIAHSSTRNVHAAPCIRAVGWTSGRRGGLFSVWRRR